jgi:Major Facilitator Superfamily
MAVLDSSIVNVALPKMSGTLACSIEEITWVVTAYILSNVIVMPMIAMLSARFGRKRVYLTSVVLFTASSMACGLARTLPLMIVFRVLQGAGGGVLQTVSQAILRETFPPEEQGIAMGLFGMGAVVGAGRRADAGRLADRQLFMAVDFLHQRPDRDRERPPGDPFRTRPRFPEARQRGDRLAGAVADDRRPGRAPAHAGEGGNRGMARLRLHPGAGGGCRRRTGGVRLARAHGARARGRPAAAPQRDLQLGDDDGRHPRHRAERQPVPASRVLATEPGIPGNPGGPGPDAAQPGDAGPDADRRPALQPPGPAAARRLRSVTAAMGPDLVIKSSTAVGWLGSRSMRCARGGGDVGQNGTRSRKQRCAGGEKAHTARGSLEQLHTELVLERAHLATEGRL